MPNEPIEGELFTRNYLQPTTLLEDSARARERLAVAYEGTGVDDGAFAKLVRAELGIEVPIGYDRYAPLLFWRRAAIRDVLSAITLVYRLDRRYAYLGAVETVLRQEGLRYKIGPSGSIHPFVDEEFERSVSSALSGLDPARHRNVVGPFEKALKELAGERQSGKEIIRDVFEAVETLYLQLIPGGNRITDEGIKNSLTPRLIASYPGWAGAEEAVQREIASFQAWVKAAHLYRHGTPLEELHEAPVDYAVLLLSQGASFMRWLVKLDVAAPGPEVEIVSRENP